MLEQIIANPELGKLIVNIVTFSILYTVVSLTTAVTLLIEWRNNRLGDSPIGIFLIVFWAMLTLFGILCVPGNTYLIILEYYVS